MILEATVVAALPLEQGVSKSTGNPWSKGTIIVEIGSGTQYPKKVALSTMKKAEELIALPIGSQYTFDIDVESREYNGRWYTSCSTFRWTPVGSQPQQAPQPTYAQPQQTYAQPQVQQGNPYAQSPSQGNPYAQPQQQGDEIPF